MMEDKLENFVFWQGIYDVVVAVLIVLLLCGFRL